MEVQTERRRFGVRAPKALPLVRQMYAIAAAQKIGALKLGKTAGVAGVPDWRRRSPLLHNFQAVLNALGYELRIERLQDGRGR